VVESEFKSTCEANPNAGYCSFDGILAHDIDAYCTKRAAGVVDAPSAVTLAPYLARVASKEDCLAYEDPLEVTRAHNDWYDVLDRNYRHHEKARNQKTGMKDAAVHYNAHRYMDARYGEIEAEVEVHALEGLAPKVLIDAATAFDGTDLAEETKATFKGWNVVGFEGGGSTMEFTTSQLGENPTIKHAFAGTVENHGGEHGGSIRVQDGKELKRVGVEKDGTHAKVCAPSRAATPV